MPQNYVELECNFKKTNRNEKPIDPDLVDYKFSNYELLKGVLMRVNNRYTPEEHAYLTERLGHSPTFLNQHGHNNRVATARIIKRYIKDYRANPGETPLELDIDQYADLNKLCEEAISKAEKEKPVPEPPEDIRPPEEVNLVSDDGVIYVQLQDELVLPMLAGGCLHKGELQPIACLLDTGSTVSLAGWDYVQSLGYTREDLDNSKRYCIKTASGVQAALGTVSVKLFLQSEKKEFFRFQVELLVAECTLSKLILGYNFLKQCKFKWTVQDEAERIILDCTSRGDASVRRAFTPRRTTRPVTFTNEERMQVYSMENRQVRLVAEEAYPVFNGHMEVQIPQAYLPTHRGSEILPSEVEMKITGTTDKSGWWPTQLKTVLTTQLIFREKRSYEVNSMKINAYEVDRYLMDHADELNMVDIGNQGNDPMDQVMYDQISLTPSYLGDNQYYEELNPPNKEEPYYLPKLDHLDEEWREKFTNLFTEFKHSMSKGKSDVGEAKVPPITFPVPKDAHRDPVRVHSDTELEVITEAVDMLVKAGTVEPTDGRSEWNSNIFLVSSSSETQKKLSGTIADKVTREEQLDALRKASRCVIDFRGVNQKVPNLYPNSVVLPKIEHMLPLFYNKLISKGDIRAGFHSILLHPKVRQVTAFRLQNGTSWQYRTLPMGLHMSPQIFINVLNVVLNKKSFEKFKARFPELQNIQFEMSYLRYMDDIAIVSPKNMRVHYLLWQYLLEQFAEFNIRFNPTKCQVLESDKTEYLGILIDGTNNIYSLVPDRAQAFLEHAFPLTKASLVSRVMLYNYFRNLILFMKNITTCLMVLCREEGSYNPLPLHVREFEMLKLMIKLNVRLTLPNLLLPLMMSSDSSHTSYCSFLQQWVRPSQSSGHFRDVRENLPGVTPRGKYVCTHPPPLCDTFPCRRTAKRVAKRVYKDSRVGNEVSFPFSQPNTSRELIKEGAPPHHTRGEDDPELVICGIFSKSFHKDHLLASIPYKEAEAVISGVRHWECWLRGSTVTNFWFSDVSWISYITRLKSTSTKLYSMSVYLSSFPNLYFIFTNSRVLNCACDLVTKLDTGFFLDSDFGIPKEVLEPDSLMEDNEMGLITPQSLHRVIMSPVPLEFTDTPLRRQIKYKELPTLAELGKLLENPTPEEQVFNLMWYGSKVIKPDHYIFTQKNNPKKVITKAELTKFENKYKLDDLRTVLTKVERHSNCDHIKAFSQVEPQARDFVKQLYDYMRQKNLKLKEPTLFKLTERFLQSPVNIAKDFAQISTLFQESSLVNTSEKLVTKKQEIVQINQSEDSDLTLEDQGDLLALKLKQPISVAAKDVVVLKVNVNISSRILIDIQFNTPERLIVHLAARHTGPRTTYTKLYIANEADDPILIQPHRLLGTLKAQISDDCCQNISNIVYVIDKVQPTDQDEPTFSIISVFNTVFHPLYRTRCDEVGVPVLATAAVAGGLEQLEENQEKQLINRFLLLSHMLYNSNTISRDFVAELQNTDPDLIGIKQLIQKGKAAEFSYLGNILVKQEPGQSNIRLLLDRVTLQTMLDSLHSNGFHLPEMTILNHMERYFHHPGMKQMVRNSVLGCAACQFTIRPNRQKFINIPPEDEGLLINQVWSVDIIENLPLDNSRWHYVLLITEYVSTYTMGFALRSKTSKEVIGAMEQAFAAMNLPAVVRSDFGPAFSSEAFQEFLQEYSVAHNHSVPARSPSQGKIEILVRHYRDLLTSVVLHGGLEARKNWGSVLPRVNLVWNNTVPFAKVNSLSRYNLFHSCWRHQPGHLISAWPTADPSEMSRAQTEALARIAALRNQQRGLYKTKENPFQEDSLVTIVTAKSEQPSIDSGSGILPTSANIYRVVSSGPSGCQLISLNNSDQRTVDMSKLRRLSPRQILPNIGKLPLTKSNFDRHVFRSGSGRTLLETLVEEGRRRGKSPEALVQEEEYIAEPAVESQPDLEVREEVSPRYKLRSRTVYHAVLVAVNHTVDRTGNRTGNFTGNQTGNRIGNRSSLSSAGGRKKKKKTVRFDPLVHVAPYYTKNPYVGVHPLVLWHHSYQEPLKLVRAERVVDMFLSSVPNLDLSGPEQILFQLGELERTLRV